MASASAISMAMPLTHANQNKVPSKGTFFRPFPLRSSKAIMGSSRSSSNKFEIKASLKEKAVTGLTAAALTASMVIPDVAEAASGVSPSLKNFLLSIVSGGVVLSVLVGAVIGVANFDPVKRV